MLFAANFATENFVFFLRVYANQKKCVRIHFTPICMCSRCVPTLLDNTTIFHAQNAKMRALIGGFPPSSADGGGYYDSPPPPAEGDNCGPKMPWHTVLPVPVPIPVDLPGPKLTGRNSFIMVTRGCLAINPPLRNFCRS